MEDTAKTKTFIRGKDALIRRAQSRDARKNRGKTEPNAKPNWRHTWIRLELMTTNREQNPTRNVTSTPPGILTTERELRRPHKKLPRAVHLPIPSSYSGQQKLHQAESRVVPILQQKILQFGNISRTPLKSQRKSFFSWKKEKEATSETIGQKGPSSPHQ